MVIAIDDAQWLDPASTRTLTFAIRRLGAVPVGVLVTRRGSGGPPLLGFDDALPQSAGSGWCWVRSAPRTWSLVEERLGEPPVPAAVHLAARSR